MRILTCNPSRGAFTYVLAGIRAAFSAAGHPATRSDGSSVPPDFDLYRGASGWRQWIPPRRNRKLGSRVGIHVNPFGPTRVGSIDGGPPIDESQDAIRWVLAQEPDFVYVSTTDRFKDEYYGS